MASQIEICNNAIYRLNGQAITALTDPSKEAVILNRIYNNTRQRLLRSHFWNFAVKKVELPQLTTTPAFEHTYAYQLPSDCLRVIRVYNPTNPWVIVGKEIHTDDDVLYLEYVADVSDEGQWDSMFTELMILRLALDMCYAITGSTEMIGALRGDYAQAMREAKQFDAMEDYPRQWDNGTWYDSKGYPGG